MNQPVKGLVFLLLAALMIVSVQSDEAIAQQTASSPAPANAGDLRLIVAPQVWFSHIPNTPQSQAGTQFDRTPSRLLFPQWGGSLGLGWGSWTFAVSALSTHYVVEESFQPSGAFLCGAATCFGRVTDEHRINRTDIDFVASYTFLDVVKDFIDMSVGAGIKWVSLDGTVDRINPPGTLFAANRRGRFTFDENIVGPTLPIGVNFHVTERLFMPVTVSPYVAKADYTNTLGEDDSGTYYGGTADIGLRYVFSNGVALEGGYRGQFLVGFDTYGAHGPYVRLLIPFSLGK